MTIPIENLYFLLCYAWDHLEEATATAVGTAKARSLPDLFARVLASGTERALKRGLSRGYRPFREQTSRPRGRIDFVASAASSTGSRSTLVCESDELSFNVLHNRVLRTTLRQLARVRGLDRSLSAELRGLYRRLPPVDDVALSPAVFRRFQFGGNERIYHFLMRVCELAYHSQIVESESGSTVFSDFERDEVKMRLLFQNFVRNYLRHHLPSEYTVRSRSFEWQRLVGTSDNLKFFPRMNTDIVVESRERCVVIDTKYESQPFVGYHGQPKLKSGYLYQLFAYIENFAVLARRNDVQGMLIYPANEHSFDLRYNVLGRPLRAVSLDLHQPWTDVGADLLELIEDLDEGSTGWVPVPQRPTVVAHEAHLRATVPPTASFD